MEINKILTADVLDIIFDGRNKEYGAYELRKTYNRRLRTAMLVTAAVVLLLAAGFLVSNIKDSRKTKAMVVQDVQLEDIKEEKKDLPPPPPPPKVEPPKVEMAKFTPPKIVKDEEVKEEEQYRLRQNFYQSGDRVELSWRTGCLAAVSDEKPALS